MRKVILGSLFLATISNAGAVEANPKLPGQFSGNIGVVSDYVFRGISQSRENPALQGNVDFVFDQGLKVGVWGSNVDFNDNSNVSAEYDFYGSYSQKFDELKLEGVVTHYVYPGANETSNYDYTEFNANAEYDFGFLAVQPAIYYSPDFFAASGKAFYPKITIKAPLVKGFSVDGSFGRQYVENNELYGVPDYNDWSLGLAYNLESFSIKAQYIDSSIREEKCQDNCDSKLVLTLNKSF